MNRKMFRLYSRQQRLFSSTSERVGFIGLGKIGLAMSNNFIKNGYALVCYDSNHTAIEKAKSKYDARFVDSLIQVASESDIIFSVLPNDKILNAVSQDLLPHLRPNQIHVSCSTVGPETSRILAKSHEERNCSFVAAPVFARPDGMANAQATIPVSGPNEAVRRVIPILKTTSTGVYEFGEDPGSANVVKLCGNYLIATAIQSMAESMQIAESNGVDRVKVMQMLNSTIFDCLIYKGYGQRVSERDHYPYEDAHFSLELGKKDVKLCTETAEAAGVPLPFGNALLNRFVSSTSKGRNDLDWSAISLLQSEDAGMTIDDSKYKPQEA